jgi:hypothetical protein
MGFSLAVLIAISPLLTIFIIIMSALAVAQWYYVVFFGGLVFAALLLGSGMFGYNSGPLWHYHGTPEVVKRPDVEQLIGVEK